MAHYNNKRNNSNTDNIKVRELPSSGFDLSYKSKDSGAIGLRKLVGYELCMSGDKMRINTAADLQYQPTNAPMLPSMDMRIEHVFIPFRNVNVDYEDMLSYDKGQAWSSDNFPKVNLLQLVNSFMGKISESSTSLGNRTLSNLQTLSATDLRTLFGSATAQLMIVSRRYFIDDFWFDYDAHLEKLIDPQTWGGMTASAKRSTLVRACYDMFRYFFGEGSTLDNYNMPIIHYGEFAASFESGSPLRVAMISTATARQHLPIDVMLLRALYADWFETTRDSNLEPARSLPRYHKLGNAVEDLDQIVFCYITPRYSLLGKDIFTTANIDSPYRHVVAPILTDEFQELGHTAVSMTGTDTNDVQGIYRTMLNNGARTELDIISNNYGTLRHFMETTELTVAGLDLVALKRAKQAKDWLMRGHVYGDEYQDYVLAQYGVKIEDSRINKPLYLGGYSKEVNIDTTVNPTATTEMPAGAKNTTMTSGGTSDSFDFYTSENGVVLTWLYIVPAVTYEPYEVRNTIMQGIDFPTPVFANDSEELSVYAEMNRKAGSSEWLSPFGRHPYAHAWRSRVDENHGQFLNEYQPYTFLRQFESAPNLNAAFVHTHVNLDFMVDTDAFNPIWFGTISHNNYVVRKLPIVTDEC